MLDNERRMDDSEGSKFATRDWVKLMIEHTVVVPLARIEDKLASMELQNQHNDNAARDRKRTWTDYLAPLGAALGAWLLMLVSKHFGLI